jgi:hypothetical protein
LEHFEAAAQYVGHLGDFDIVNQAAGIRRPNWEWADWVIFDLHLIRGVDVVIRLPGSDESAGARTELEFAKGLGLPCIDLADFRASLVERESWARKG